MLHSATSFHLFFTLCKEAGTSSFVKETEVCTHGPKLDWSIVAACLQGINHQENIIRSDPWSHIEIFLSVHVLMPFIHHLSLSVCVCVFPSSHSGWRNYTCWVEKFARVQRAFRAEATEETDAPGDPRGQGRDAARRLQGEDRHTDNIYSHASTHAWPLNDDHTPKSERLILSWSTGRKFVSHLHTIHQFWQRFEYDACSHCSGKVGQHPL